MYKEMDELEAEMLGAIDNFAAEGARTLLRTGPHIVTFTKADGTERVMNCTLEHDVISEQFGESEKIDPDAKPSSTLRVWDLDKEAWRSFRIESVTSFEPFKAKEHIL